MATAETEQALLAARKRLVEAMDAIKVYSHGDVRIRIDGGLAFDLESAWAAYDCLVAAAAVGHMQQQLATARGTSVIWGPDTGPHPMHPAYGPCDAFVPGGACSECYRIWQQLWHFTLWQRGV